MPPPGALRLLEGDTLRERYTRRRVLDIDAVEKSWGPNYLRFGLGLAAYAGATIDHVGLAGDPRGGVAGQEHERRHQLVRLAEASHRRAACAGTVGEP